MNYLAHLRLVGPGEDARIGALLGDFMRGLELTDFAPGIRAGVLHHREVDRFADAHPTFRRSRARLATPFRRYSGVVIDVFYDHFLARGWDRYSSQRLPEFAAEIYEVLERRLPELPERLQRVVPHLVAGDWLSSYASAENVERALRGLARRVKRDNPLGEAIGELHAHYVELQVDFDEFFVAIRSELDGFGRMDRPQRF